MGWASAHFVQIDVDAAGHGWYVDLTPGDDVEFVGHESPTVAGVDLLSVVSHEIGHLLGLDHDDDDHDVMGETLAPGTRPTHELSTTALRSSAYSSKMDTTSIGGPPDDSNAPTIQSPKFSRIWIAPALYSNHATRFEPTHFITSSQDQSDILDVQIGELENDSFVFGKSTIQMVFEESDRHEIEALDAVFAAFASNIWDEDDIVDANRNRQLS